MRTLYLLGLIYIALFLSSCTTTTHTENPPPAKPCASCHAEKDPLNVSFLNSEPPGRPYHVLGKATVSQYNKVGIKRQEATVKDLMSQLAAAQGGDALMNIRKHGDEITGTVISYQQILV